jgi:hypothetical protein
VRTWLCEPVGQKSAVFLSCLIGVDRVREKNGCAQANQKCNKQGHERASRGKRARYLLRE